MAKSTINPMRSLVSKSKKLGAFSMLKFWGKVGSPTQLFDPHLEVFWSQKKDMNWDGFAKRMKVHFQRSNLAGMNYSKAV